MTSASTLPRTIVFGATGYIGRHLLASYRTVHPDALGTTRRRTDCLPGLAHLDLEAPDLRGLDLEGCRHAVLAGGATRIEACERDPAKTGQVNVVGTLELVRQLQDRDILPIYLSTDYVFDGTRQEGYDEQAQRNPRTEYGRQKAAVEEALTHTVRPHLVLRLSKIFGLRRGDGTLLDEMAGHLHARRPIKAARDQVFCSIWVADLVRVIHEIQCRGLLGTINLAPPWFWSRYELARKVARCLRAPDDLVHAISLDDLPGLARRPKCTRLLALRLQREVDFRFTPLDDCLEQLAREYVP